MWKNIVHGKIITVHGEEEYMISHLNSFWYVELDSEFIETPFQHFEEVPQEVAVTKTVSQIPKITRPPLRMSSVKDAKEVVEGVDAPSGGNFRIFRINLTNLA